MCGMETGCHDPIDTKDNLSCKEFLFSVRELGSLTLPRYIFSDDSKQKGDIQTFQDSLGLAGGTITAVEYCWSKSEFSSWGWF